MAARIVVYFLEMSTLTEIEAAADKLPVPQKEALIERLTLQVRQERSAGHSQGNLAQFSGVLHLDQDPLAWQQRVRGEW
jgi:hypothetical protein